MSVLIEACCLVVNHQSFEVATSDDEYDLVSRAADLPGIRYAVSDGALIAVSALGPEPLQAVISWLTDAGLAMTDAELVGDFTLVDMMLGEIVPSTWLETEAHRHGFRTASLVGADGRAFVAPDGWEPQNSWGLHRYDLRDAGPDRVVPMGINEDGLETALDLKTGHVVAGSPERGPAPLVDVDVDDMEGATIVPTADPRLLAAQGVLIDRGIPYRVDTEQQGIHVLFALDDAPPLDALLENATLAQITDVLAAHFDEEEPEDDVRLQIQMSAGTASDELRYRVLMPTRIDRCFLREREYQKVFTDRLQLPPTVACDVDAMTGTWSLAVDARRVPNESWEQAIERGFTSASKAGSDAFRAMPNGVFEELAPDRPLYRALARAGLLLDGYDERAFHTLVRDFYSPRGPDDVPPRHKMGVLIIDVHGRGWSSAQREAAERLLAAYPPFESFSRGHFFSLLVVDVEGRLIFGVGLGRKDRVFDAVSHDGGPFEFDVSAHKGLWAYSFRSELRDALEEVGVLTYEREQIPYLYELDDLLQRLTEESAAQAPAGEGVSEADGDDEDADGEEWEEEEEELPDVTEEEIREYLAERDAVESRIRDAGEKITALFPHIDPLDLSPGDY